MAVPVLNMKISDIVAALGEQSTNIGLKNLHLSPKVIGSGLDSTYCPGANGYERLANLRDTANKGGVRSFYIGKFRNYDHLAVAYRTGLHYNYWAARNWITGGTPPWGGSWHDHTVAIPSGWRIMTETDWWNVIKELNSAWDWSSNGAAGLLKSSLRSNQAWCGWESPHANSYGFNKLRSGSFMMIQMPINPDQTKATYRIVKFPYATLWIEKTGVLSFAVVFNDETGTLQRIVTSDAYPFENGNFFNIRLIQGDAGTYNSNDPKSVEDVEGNVYPTVKIGNYVMTAENIRTKVSKAGNALVDYSNMYSSENIIVTQDIYHFRTPGFIDHTIFDIA